MLQKIKNIWANPYYAPLTEPLGNVGGTVKKSLSGYIEAVEDAFNDRYASSRTLEKSRAARIYKNLVNDDDGIGFAFLNGIGMAIAGVFTGLAGGSYAYLGLAGAGAATKILATGAAGVAAATLGVMAAPIVLAAGIAAAATVVGAVIGVVPGVIGGTMKALRHHKDLKNPPPAPAANAPAPAAPSQQQIHDGIAAGIYNDFQRLPLERQHALIEAIEKRLVPWRSGEERVLRVVQDMNQEQCVALIETLEKKLGSAFDAVARKKLAEAAALNDDISVQPIAVKPRRRNPAQTADNTSS